MSSEGTGEGEGGDKGGGEAMLRWLQCIRTMRDGIPAWPPTWLIFRLPDVKENEKGREREVHKRVRERHPLYGFRFFENGLTQPERIIVTND